MISEFRRYRVKVGKVAEYLSAFETIALPLINRHMHLLGFWTSDVGELNCVFHLWAFESLERRTARYAALRAEPDYQGKFLPLVLPIMEEMHSTILTPVGFSCRLPLDQDVEWKTAFEP
jgi:hypothetical protein